MRLEVQLHTLLTLTLDDGKGHSPPPPPGTRWIGGWVGLRIGLDTVVVDRKNSRPRQESNSCHPASSLVPILAQLTQSLV